LDGYKLEQWRIPWGTATHPRAATADGHGGVWFVDETDDLLGRFDEATHQFERHPVEPGSRPTSLAIAGDVIVITASGTARLISFKPATGAVTRRKVPVVQEPRNPRIVIVDPGSGLTWFTAESAGSVGRFDPSTGAFLIWDMRGGAAPSGIAVDKRGRAWFAEAGADSIGMIDPQARRSEQFPLRVGERAQCVAVASDGAVWYTDYADRMLGRLDPATGALERFAMPSDVGDSSVAIVADDRDGIWIAETGVVPNRIVAFDARRRIWGPAIAVADSAPNALRDLTFDSAGRSLWFAVGDGMLGRLSLPRR
jgi:virginiamycin B lyase